MTMDEVRMDMRKGAGKEIKERNGDKAGILHAVTEADIVSASRHGDTISPSRHASNAAALPSMRLQTTQRR